jgi:pyridoxal phosphate enzyme (YggS family)
MHSTVQNLINIDSEIKSSLKKLQIKKIPKIIAVSKTFNMDKIAPLIEYGHIDFGENKVQEAVDKWTVVKETNKNIKLHMIGKLQTNKVKFAVKIFDYIHSVDSEKLAKKIADEQLKYGKKIKVFIQVNLGNESQKSGIDKDQIKSLIAYCSQIKLSVIGLMCIPPMDLDPLPFFKQMKQLNEYFNFNELSMGMSSDYLVATNNSATYLRIGSSIFGQRS